MNSPADVLFAYLGKDQQHVAAMAAIDLDPEVLRIRRRLQALDRANERAERALGRAILAAVERHDAVQR